MLVVALRLPSGRLATRPWSSTISILKHDRLSFSTNRLCRVAEDCPKTPRPEDGPDRTQSVGRRRSGSTARPKTGTPIPPPIPEWFFYHHVYDPRIVQGPHTTAGGENAQFLRVRVDNTFLEILYFPADAHPERPSSPDETAQSDEEQQSRPTHGLLVDAKGKTSSTAIRNVNSGAHRRPSEALAHKTSDPITGKNGKQPLTRKVEEGPNEIKVSDIVKSHKSGTSIPDAAADRKCNEHASSDAKASVEPPTNYESLVTSIQEIPGLEGDVRPFQGLDWALFHVHLLVSSSFMLTPSSGEADRNFSHSHLMLNTTDPETYYKLQDLVHNVVDMSEARLISLDAGTIAELAGEYIDGPTRGPGTVSDLAYDAYEGCVEPDLNTSSVPEGDAEDDILDPSSPPDPKSLLKGARNMLVDVMNSMKMTAAPEPESPKEEDDVHIPELTRWQALKLEAFWDGLLDAGPDPRQQPTREMLVEGDFTRSHLPSALEIRIRSHDDALLSGKTRLPPHGVSRLQVARRFDHDRIKDGKGSMTMRLQLAQYLKQATFSTSAVPIEGNTPLPPVPNMHGTQTIIHIRDLNVIRDTPQGDVIIQRLLKSIEKRRRTGEAIVVIGTNQQDLQDPEFDYNAENDRDFMHIPISKADDHKWRPRRPTSLRNSNSAQVSAVVKAVRKDIVYVNLRNLQAHARALQAVTSPHLFGRSQILWLHRFGQSDILGQTVLSREQVHEVVLFANAFCHMYTTDTEMRLSHICFAAAFLAPRLGYQVQDHAKRVEVRVNRTVTKGASSRTQIPSGTQPRGINMVELLRSCNSYEKRLLSGLREPAKLKTTFDQVHAPAATIDTLQTITGLALLRPDAFSYGVLADSRLSGLLLYGPPGTGKTMLAKAVAKDASCAVLEVSGAQIYDKYVGEGEKMVRAVFSLGKKLSPCIVFVDEADALFSTRSNDRQRTTHREIITQFLAEWDGMAEHNVFVMVATNRPFDLDDAVLRRLPRRVLVDLPTVADRESILRIQLKGEMLDESISLKQLAEQTPFFSGSDLKNLSVAAALAAVKAENALSRQHKDDKDFKLPGKRTLTKQHFDTAMEEISASISEDMDSLKAIKKFDEKYGEGRDKRLKKKSGFGFGGESGRQSDDAARVRGPS